MFDLDAGKMLVFGIVALAVIPPKDLPRVLRTVGQYVGKMRRMASEFQGQFMDAMKEAERAADLESVKKEIHSLDESAKIEASFGPTPEKRFDLTNGAEPPTTMSSQVVPEAGPSSAPSDPFSAEVVVKAPSVEDPPPTGETRAPSAAP